MLSFVCFYFVCNPPLEHKLDNLNRIHAILQKRVDFMQLMVNAQVSEDSNEEDKTLKKGRERPRTWVDFFLSHQ